MTLCSRYYIDRGDSLYNSANTLNTPELYVVNGCIVRYVYYISIKLLKVPFKKIRRLLRSRASTLHARKEGRMNTHGLSILLQKLEQGLFEAEFIPMAGVTQLVSGTARSPGRFLWPHH